MTVTTFPTNSYGAISPKKPLEKISIQRRNPGSRDVLIEILFCGVCHSDIHQVRNEWGEGAFPMVPGHEITGLVREIGSAVTKWQVGDRVGVGCMVDSCRTCSSCDEHLEQYCENGATFTYNSVDKKIPDTFTQGGYSKMITVDQDFVFKIPDSLELDVAAPLLCAGITTYSPMKFYGVTKGSKVGIVGLGGLGHMAIKIAKALGAHVTVLSRSPNKQNDASKLGADDFVVINDQSFADHRNKFDFLVDVISAEHDYNAYNQLLKRDGTNILLGIPPELVKINIANLVLHRKKMVGSLIGGTKETQEMLDFCAKHNIFADIEKIHINQINEAYERMLKSDVKYRFVIDMSTLEA